MGTIARTQFNSQGKDALVQLIKWKMDLLGINTDAELSRRSGVPADAISRFFNGPSQKFTIKYMFLILLTLDLLKTENYPPTLAAEATKRLYVVQEILSHHAQEPERRTCMREVLTALK